MGHRTGARVLARARVPVLRPPCAGVTTPRSGGPGAEYHRLRAGRHHVVHLACDPACSSSSAGRELSAVPGLCLVPALSPEPELSPEPDSAAWRARAAAAAAGVPGRRRSTHPSEL